MSRTTEYWFEVQEELRENWIRDHLSDEYSEEWDELAQEYDLIHEGLREAAEFEAEYRWLREQTYSELHDKFVSEISTLKELISTSVAFHHEDAFFKMIYAHAVTLLETFLGDTAISLVIENPKYFANSISKVDELKKTKFSLTEISEESDGAKGLAVKTLSTVLYHNIPKAKRILESIIGSSLSVAIDKVGYITSVRHDIVHRNGKTLDGEKIDIDREITSQAIEDIESFVRDLQIKINEHGNA